MIIKMEIWQFALIYILLIVILAILKIAKVNQTKLLIVATIRMSVQLVLAGFVLTYILENPHWGWTVGYIVLMLIFASVRILRKNKGLNKKFKMVVILSLIFSSMSSLLYFVGVVVNAKLFDPQYSIPIGGMIVANSMTGILIGLKKFTESLEDQRLKIETLTNIGAKPKDILMPFVNNALETALVPTMTSMCGMGIIALPGMMTGQILSGTIPTTAIMYQIAIMIAILTSVCLGVFSSLYFGYKTLITKNDFINLDYKK